MANGQRAGPDNSGNVDNLLSMMWNEGARLSLRSSLFVVKQHGSGIISASTPLNSPCCILRRL